MRFERWGSFRPQRHDNGNLPTNSEERRYHTPPQVWGFYAFPRGHVCFWLLGCGDVERLKRNGRLHWVRDENGEKVEVTKDLECFDQCFDYRFGKDYSQREKRLRRINRIRGSHCLIRRTYYEGRKNYFYYEKPSFFNYAGDIWHHLELFEYKFIKDIDTKDETCSVRRIRLVPEEEILDRRGSWIKTSMRTYKKAFDKYRNFEKYYLSGYWSSPKIQERNEKNDIDDGFIEENQVMEVFIEKL